ncbi:MAG TPA: glycerate kinase, partial [Candidatus Dormibacteraeota bacterium]|nr:glycerate kinase [Candidatus Dormibacteraeota bacterium]
MALGVADAGGVAIQRPVADGGDGTLDVLIAAAGPTAARAELEVTGPLGNRVLARLGWLRPGEAVVEMAEAAGLRRLPGTPDALHATSFGAGELIAAALDSGATRIVVGVGGSATTDGGA